MNKFYRYSAVVGLATFITLAAAQNSVPVPTPSPATPPTPSNQGPASNGPQVGFYNGPAPKPFMNLHGSDRNPTFPAQGTSPNGEVSKVDPKK